MQNKELRYYCIGDFVIEYDGPKFKEREYLAKFRVVERKPDVSYKVLVCPETEMSLNVKDTCDGVNHTVWMSELQASKMHSRLVLNLFNIPYQIIAHDAMFLHASYIIWKEKAILFTAPKQVGKTTQAKLWEKYAGAKVVNGDRALLRKKDNLWMVHGSPYCGTSKICENISAPLGAIVILSQALQNRIERAKTTDAVIAFMDGVSFRVADKAQVEKVADMVNDIIKNIPIYKLECTPTESSVKLLEEMLW